MSNRYFYLLTIIIGVSVLVDVHLCDAQSTPTPTPPPTVYTCWNYSENLDVQINSAAVDWHAFIAADNTTLYFGSVRPGGYGRSDIYVSDFIGPALSDWSLPVNLGPNINTSQLESAPSLTGDMQRLYFMGYNVSVGNLDIYFSSFNPVTMEWNKRILVKDPVSLDSTDDRHPFIYRDESKILIDSNRPGGYGGFDLWEISFYKGQWAGARALPESVNSSANETAPFVWEGAGEKLLFFETDRAPGRNVMVSSWDPILEDWDNPLTPCFHGLPPYTKHRPSIDGDYYKLYFHAPGAVGSDDIYVGLCDPSPTPTGTWYSPTPTHTYGKVIVPVNRAWLVLFMFALLLAVFMFTRHTERGNVS